MAIPTTSRARLLRDIAKIERELDKAMNALARTQKAMLAIGEDITAMHQSLLTMKASLDKD